MVNSSNNISEKFLLLNLKVDQRQLDFLICAGSTYRNMITDAVVAYGPNLALQLSTCNTWKLSDTLTGTSHCLSIEIANRMVLSLALDDVDLTDIANDPFPAEPMNEEWKVVPLSVIDLYAGSYDIKKYEAKQFTCTYLAPNFFRLLSLSPEFRPLYTHLMDLAAPMRGYLFYLLLKAKISAKKQAEWKEVLRDRNIRRLFEKTRTMQINLANLELSHGSQNAQYQAQLDAEKLKDLESKMKTIERANIAILEQIAQNQEASDRMVENMAQKHDASNRMVEQIAQNQETVSQRQEATDSTVERMAQTQETINQKLRLQQAQLASHQEQIDDIHQDTRSLLSEAVSAFTTSLDVKLAALTAQGATGQGAAPEPSDTGSHEIFLRLRNCTEEVEELAADFGEFRRIWTAGEGNRIVSRAITRSIITSRSTFLIALIGYSGGGKSYTAFGCDGLLYAILERLPPAFIEVTEVLDQKHSLGAFTSNDQSPSAIAATIATTITENRRKAENIANKESSRGHLVVRFEDQATGRLLGMLIDVAGPELSEHIKQLQPEMQKESDKIANDNINIRHLLEAYANAGDVTVLRRASKLNRVVEQGLGEAKGKAIVVRVVLCCDGSSSLMAGKTRKMVPTFGVV